LESAQPEARCGGLLGPLVWALPWALAVFDGQMRYLAASERWYVDGLGCVAGRRSEHALITALRDSRYAISGRGPFGEEFVTAGGIPLAEVNLATMESRLQPGLFLVGELLDVDGVTGGFNFQHCWSSGWLAGQALAAQLTGA
jgi:hypothetical protein